MIKIVSKGDFKKTKKFLNFVERRNEFESLEKYGRQGVAALSSATPVDSGLTASCWDYVIDSNKNGISLTWTNSNTTEQGTPIVVLIQYGHGTKDGYFIEGRDFINPAIRPIFEDIAESVWQEVNNA